MKFKRSVLPLMIWSLLYACSGIAQSHNRENVWVFGELGGMDFNGGAPRQIPTAIKGFNGASVCDTNGQLLFYTNGCRIWDRAHNLMPAGGNLFFPYTPADPEWYLFPDRNYSGCLIVPMPGNDSKYYVFSMTQAGSVGTVASEEPFVGRLYYSIVNMQLNGGFGDVEAGKKMVFIDSLLGSNMTAVVGDRCNIWLVTTTRGNKDSFSFRSYEISESGINLNPVVSPMISLPLVPGIYFDHLFSGVMKISPDRTKLVLTGYANKMYDFDPATGSVSNPRVLDDPPVVRTTRYSGGAAFSPDNSKLYVHTRRNFSLPVSPYTIDIDSIYQHDLSNGGLRTAIAEGYDADGAMFKAGPDGKLYTRGALDSIACIHEPNLPGTACNYQPRMLYMGPYNSVFINYGPTGEVPVLEKKYTGSRKTLVACFNDSVVLDADTSGTSWDVLWENGSGDARRSVFNSGTYIVSYRTSPCTHHTDTFIVRKTIEPAVGIFYPCRSSPGNMAWVTPGNTDTCIFTWTDSGGSIVHQKTTNLPDTVYNLFGGWYTLKIKAASGCDTTMKIGIFPTDSGTRVSFNPDKDICASGPVRFSNTSTPGFSSYRWDFGDHTQETIASPVHVYQQAGTYIVTLIGETSGGCSDTAFATITVKPRAEIRLGPDTFICRTARLFLNPTGDNSYRYQWSPASAVSNHLTKNTVFISKTTQTLILEATNTYGCKASDTILIAVDSSASLSVNDTLICLGDTVRLSATGADRYRWLSYSGYISDTLIANPWISPAETWLYRVIGTKISGCVDTADAMVRVDTPSDTRFSMDRNNICRGQVVKLTPEYGKGTIRNVVWDFGDGSASGPAAMHRYDSAGIFIISLTAQFLACPDHSFYDTLVVHDYPVVYLGRDTVICPGSPPIRLTNLWESASSLKYQWSTGDTSLNILVQKPGIYYVRGISGDDCGVTDTVRIERSCYLDIPNAFTPNGDGDNDYFFPRKLLSGNLSAFKMSIYNRWGQLIYQTSGADGNGWDGKLNGVAQPVGVYVYLIEAVIDDNVSETYKGNISLLR